MCREYKNLHQYSNPKPEYMHQLENDVFVFSRVAESCCKISANVYKI